MEWIAIMGRNLGLFTVLYGAVTIELTYPTQAFAPSAIALAVTWIVGLSRPTPAIFWAAVGGFFLDVMTPGRLGPFVMSYGLMVCMLLSLASTARSAWWLIPTLAFALAAVQPLVLALIARIEAAPVIVTESLLTTVFVRGGSTACASIMALFAVTIFQRMWSSTHAQEPLALTNRWRMITD